MLQMPAPKTLTKFLLCCSIAITIQKSFVGLQVVFLKHFKSFKMNKKLKSYEV